MIARLSIRLRRDLAWPSVVRIDNVAQKKLAWSHNWHFCRVPAAFFRRALRFAWSTGGLCYARATVNEHCE